VDPNLATDTDLIHRARRGDESAFSILYQQHRRSVFQFAWRLTGSRTAAEDITQECFLALLDGAAYDPAFGRLRTYLFGIVRHRAMRRVRAAERESAELPEAPAATDTLGAMLASERASMIERAIASLPDAQREALIFFEYEGLSMEEIAQLTGSETGAIKARLFRARESLRRKLAPLMADTAAREIA
jgi:RNA polymerase sigma-70 factor, ECF subfamily